MYAIQTKDLTKKYQNFQALDQVNLSIAPGEIYGFIGLNGAGKTSTMRMLLNMIKPTSGRAEILGQDVNHAPASFWNQVGYLIETPHAYQNLTVAQNLALYGQLRLLSKVDRQKRITELMAALSLTPYQNHKVRDLSLGNNQKIGLIKALMHRPKILLLDEPTNGLDSLGMTAVRHLLIEEARQNGTTILISSHILDEMAKMVTTIGVLHHGQLLMQQNRAAFQAAAQKIAVLQFETAELTLKAQHQLASQHVQIDLEQRQLQIGVQQTNQLAQMQQQLMASGISVMASWLERESLEQYFLKKIGDQDAK